MRKRLVVLLLLATSANADGVLDHIRNYDLNDYALGLAYTVQESPYRGADSKGFAYAYLTSFRHSAFTDDWLLLTDGDVGARWVNDAGWVLGGVVRVRTEGTDTTLLDELTVPTRWVVVGTKRKEFFRLTKRLHNLIHGEGDPDDDYSREGYGPLVQKMEDLNYTVTKSNILTQALDRVIEGAADLTSDDLLDHRGLGR